MRTVVRNIGLCLIALSLLTVVLAFPIEVRFELHVNKVMLAFFWTFTGFIGLGLYLVGRTS